MKTLTHLIVIFFLFGFKKKERVFTQVFNPFFLFSWSLTGLRESNVHMQFNFADGFWISILSSTISSGWKLMSLMLSIDFFETIISHFFLANNVMVSALFFLWVNLSLLSFLFFSSCLKCVVQRNWSRGNKAYLLGIYFAKSTGAVLAVACGLDLDICLMTSSECLK